MTPADLEQLRKSERDRKQRARELKRAGQCALPRVWVDTSGLAEGLIERGFLSGWDRDDPAKILAAAAEFIRFLSEHE